MVDSSSRWVTSVGVGTWPAEEEEGRTNNTYFTSKWKLAYCSYNLETTDRKKKERNLPAWWISKMGDRLMYHFSLSLCRDPLNWLTHWTDGVESYKSEEICGWLYSQWFHLTSQETSYLKKRPVGWFLSFIFLRLISLYQILLDCHYHYLLLW